jgi:hypothetical protein
MWNTLQALEWGIDYVFACAAGDQHLQLTDPSTNACGSRAATALPTKRECGCSQQFASNAPSLRVVLTATGLLKLLRLEYGGLNVPVAYAAALAAHPTRFAASAAEHVAFGAAAAEAQGLVPRNRAAMSLLARGIVGVQERFPAVQVAAIAATRAHAATGGATGLDIDEDVEMRPSRRATMFTEPADDPVALTYTKQHRELCAACEVEYGEGDDACLLVCITVPGRVNFGVIHPRAVPSFCMRPVCISLVIIRTKQAGWPESDLTAHAKVRQQSYVVRAPRGLMVYSGPSVSAVAVRVLEVGVEKTQVGPCIPVGINTAIKG